MFDQGLLICPTNLIYRLSEILKYIFGSGAACVQVTLGFICPPPLDTHTLHINQLHHS